MTKYQEIFNSKVDQELKVTHKYFSRVFNNNFNIGFGSPPTDVCGFCARTQTQIINSVNITDKANLKTELKIYKFRAERFYKLL